MSEQSPLFSTPEDSPDTPVDPDEYTKAAALAARPARKPRYSAAAIEQGYAPVGYNDTETDNIESETALKDSNTNESAEIVEQSSPTRKRTVAEQNAAEADYVAKHHRSLYE